MRPVLIDAGPLVAGIDRRDTFHDWALDQIRHATAPLLTCDAVLSEACFLLQHTRGGVRSLMGLLREGAIRAAFSCESEMHALADLIERYESVPMSFADACLVRMTELIPRSRVMTLDQAIPLITPST